MKKKRILVVEDEAIVAMDIKMRLTNLGYDVVACVASGEEALTQAGTQRPDLVLMDIIIKGPIDGIETAELIQGKYDLPVVYLTANSDEATLERAKSTGPLAYLLKPFEERELKTTIEIAYYRHELEQKLRASERWWSTTLSGIGDGVVATDQSGNIIFMNAEAERLTGWNFAQAKGKSIDRIFNIRSDKAGKTIANPVREALKSGQREVLDLDCILEQKDGSVIPIDDSAAPIFLGDNDLQGAVLVFRDISLRRERELELEQYRERLEEMVSERTAALERANANLVNEMKSREEAQRKEANLQQKLAQVERMKSVGVMAGGVAHDLNNTLGPLIGYPDLILQKLPADSEFKNYIERMQRAAFDAAAVIQDLLTLARRGKYDMAPTNIRKMVLEYRDSPGFSKLQQENPDVVVDFELSKDLPEIAGSSAQLSKVLMNLIVNAFDAIRGEGRITVRAQVEALSQLINGFSEIASGDYVVLTVSDSGCGIPKHNLKRIFDPYYSSKKMQGRSGTGLGLSVVYGVIKDHSGYYDIVTSEGQGTTFYIYLPVTTPVRSGQGITQDQQEVIGGTEEVLVVDDDLQQRDLMNEILKDLGYAVTLVEDGRDAVELVTSQKFDLIILDMVMEVDFDGLDTYREIVKLEPNQPAMIVSGFSETDRVQEAMTLGVRKYLKKPFTIKSLAEGVREALAATAVTADREVITR